jgi:hypothetical protein
MDNNNIYNKYLKYKNKYLSLKQKQINIYTNLIPNPISNISVVRPITAPSIPMPIPNTPVNP